MVQQQLDGCVFIGQRAYSLLALCLKVCTKFGDECLQRRATAKQAAEIFLLLYH
jgi:hypothetical protein